MFTFKRNTRTNNLEAQFSAKLISLSESVQQNSNGTDYRVGTIEFSDVNGNTQRSSALMYESNFAYIQDEYEKNEDTKQLECVNGVQTYLCTAINDDSRDGDNVLITVSHLTGAGRATKSMFGFENAKVEAPEVEATEEVKA
jgi:hypothetical protein